MCGCAMWIVYILLWDRAWMIGVAGKLSWCLLAAFLLLVMVFEDAHAQDEYAFNAVSLHFCRSHVVPGKKNCCL